MDYLLLSNISFFAFHGVNEQETKVGNTFTIDLKIGGDFKSACASDNIEDAINYAEIYQTVKKVMDIPCKLLEHLAEEICIALKKDFTQIESIEIKVTKINPPIVGQMDSASIILYR
jgi:dihydroneopterin aldolase